MVESSKEGESRVCLYIIEGGRNYFEPGSVS